MARKKKIAYVSGTRADFGIMSSILQAIDRSPLLELQLYITGMHLTSGFGQTDREVKKFFPGAKPIKAIFTSDDWSGVAEFAGKFLPELVGAFGRQRPDFVLILGDRSEQLCVALACLYLGIPTGHLRGGEVSASTFDELARHAITKLASLHFAATHNAAKRISRMGEESWRIKVVGEAALDVILGQVLPSEKEVYIFLRLPQKSKFILLSQHPVSYEVAAAMQQIKTSLAAIKQFKLPIVAVYPNADAGGRRIIAELDKERKNPLFRIFPSIPYKMFLALEREAAVWVGNSSGAMVESSSFALPVVNIGTRQHGRLRADNVIDADHKTANIAAAIKRALTPSFRAGLKRQKNPWGDGHTGVRVATILEKLKLEPKLLQKRLTY